ncbi:MAG: methyltransferase domain-containing protein, partial [Candidatus Latescibacterota bacterium]
AQASQAFARRKTLKAPDTARRKTLKAPDTARRKTLKAPDTASEGGGSKHPTTRRNTTKAPDSEKWFRWGFTVADAARLPFSDESFDTVVANDAMEHFAKPGAAVSEMVRVTKKGGAIWLFFTPHYSPLGSHLYDYVYTPWCHLIFRRRDLEGAIRNVLEERMPEDSEANIDNKLERIMASYDNDLNHMSIGWFHRIIKSHRELKIAFEERKPAKFQILKPLTRVPLAKELVTGTVACRLERMTA